jgi:hypothetical protein
MAMDHAFTATAIRNLTAALEALAPAGSVDVQDELMTLRQQVSLLQRDPRSTEHADLTRATFRTIAGLMSAIQQARFPNALGDVANVKAAAARLDARRPLLEQREAVQTFFDRAADAVRHMSAGAAEAGDAPAAPGGV